MEDNKALIARCNSAFVAVVGLGEECACCTFAPRFLACRPRPRCVVDGVLDAAWEGYVEGWSGDAGVIELMPSFRGKEADGPPRSIEIGLAMSSTALDAGAVGGGVLNGDATTGCR